MKKILFLAMSFLTWFVVNGQMTLNIENLDFGDFAPYEDGFVTFQKDWEAAGWGFMDATDAPDGTLKDFTDFTLELASACNFEFQIKVRYYSPGAEDPWNVGQINNFVESENIVSIGELKKTVSLGLNHSKYGYHGPEKIQAIYIQDRAEYAKYPDPIAKGTVYLKSATLANNAKTAIVYYQFEVAPVGIAYPSVDIILTADNKLDFVDGPIARLDPSIAVIVAAGKTGNGVEIFMTDFNQGLELPITLPVGTTVADVESVKFDLSMPAAAANSDIYKDLLVSINGKSINTLGVYGQIAAIGGGWVTNEVRITPEMFGYNDVKDLNTFNLYLGAKVFDTNKEIIIDNVTLVVKGSTSFVSPVPEQSLKGVGLAYVPANSNVLIYTIEGGIFVESEGAKTTVYAVDGTIVASTFNSTINLKSGLYIVKVGDAPAAKVIVK